MNRTALLKSKPKLALACLLLAGYGNSQTLHPAAASDSGQHATPEQLVDALNGVFGKQQPGVRAVHAKGVDLEGTFQPSASASSVSKAPHLQKTRVPVTVRFSDFAGIPAVPDTDGLATPRLMSIKFHLPGGSDTDIVAHSFNGFPTATTDEFRQFLIALGTSGPEAAKPTPIEVFLGSHPIAKTFLESQIPPPVSYGTVSYFGVNAFKFTNATGKVTFGRYQIRPATGDQSLPKEDVAKADPNYLSKELKERVGRGAVRFALVLEIAEPGDKLDDPSIAWPQSRKKIELGTIEITKSVPDNAAAEYRLLFIPGAVPAGIEAADPMIAARSAAYPVSFGRRKTP
jgi:catalase